MRVEHHVRAFEQLIEHYDGKLPLNRFLVNYFKQNKQMGSSDRRWASRYIYSYFRLGKALPQLPRLERLAIADFLCNQTPSLIIEAYLSNFVKDVEKSTTAKITLIKQAYQSFKLDDVFPFQAVLSNGVDVAAFQAAFQAAFFTQPDLFIRVNGTHIQAVINQIMAAGIPYQEIGDTTIALPNGTKLEKVINDARLYQVQDLSSQQTGEYFKPNQYDYWWDCCAASGGKSILLHSLEPKIELLVSDVRETSLANLQERFELAGIRKYQKKVIDLLQNNDVILHHYEFDGILLDAPCSGSGTWGRTPEMLSFFENHKVEYYAKLQKTIAANVIKYLKKDKPLIYMTCSVFKAENEEVVDYITANFGLKLESMKLIKGYDEKADSMFVARLIKQ